MYQVLQNSNFSHDSLGKQAALGVVESEEISLNILCNIQDSQAFR